MRITNESLQEVMRIVRVYNHISDENCILSGIGRLNYGHPRLILSLERPKRMYTYIYIWVC